MSDQQFSIKERSRVRLSPPKRYKVVFHNDDFTTMEFVMQVLREIFFKSEVEAFTLMMEVHKAGRASVGEYSYDVALSKKEKALALAREEGFPLKITLESDDLPF